MLIAEAPAKINLHLSVGEKRPDGYHDIASIFCTLAFGDTLCFDYAGKDEAAFLPMRGIDPEKNSIYQALKLFKKRTGFDRGVRVTVEKRIPVGAGLGGGSSDAASTLTALNKMAGTELSSDMLQSMALELGSDVPFFLRGGSAWVTGRGEKVVPLVPPERGLWVVLIFPDFQSATAEAFQFLDKLRTSHTHAAPPPPVLTEAINAPPSKWPYYNDFLEYSRHTAFYTAILGHLLRHGADFASLSGSGSTCFGIFTDPLYAQQFPEYGCGTRTVNTRILHQSI
ncbi:MAG: 4-(cytidine 5'-diphospho)-2-C-methyl-D-erythritol kinase [Spirochaetaceae bacterium]|jgi:4-diphosphocytidyl-2-C-methyl-D-erythritol kinase|nr:4-(cytidine 5'-diphospho)-2-C-methyl-D-erythritol kinase [Spirochaetaceae bacterium]